MQQGRREAGGGLDEARIGRWARLLAPAIFLLASIVSVTNLLITGTSGDTGLPPLLG